MKTFPGVVLLMGLLCTVQTAAAEFGSIVRLDPAFDALIAPNATLEILADGHDWVEGPVWDREGERLLYSDIPRNTIYAWSETGGVSVFMRPSGYTGVVDYGREPGSNGLAFDSEGRLLLCEHGDRRVSRLTPGGGKVTVADRFDGRRLNSPNDLAVHSSGAIYFTDPPYGLPLREKDPRRELEFFGVYRVSPEGTVTALIGDLPRPNGIALSPDEKTLYVAQSHGPAPVIMAYPLHEDGDVGAGRVFFDAAPHRGSGPGLPDGLKTDIDGNVWATGPGGVYVLSPAGTLLGRVVTGRPTANLAFGGPDGATLFITANDVICRIQTLTEGAGPARGE
jgi:gluconolactonase